MADAVLKILVSRLKFIGDIVLTTPVVEVLHEKFPDAVIDYLGDKEAVSLLQHNPNLNEIIPYDFSANEVREQIRIARFLRKKKYDVAIDLFGNPRSAIAIFLSGAKTRIGGSFGWRKNLFTHPIIVKERMTSVAFHLRYLAPLGIHESYRRPKIFLTEEERSRAKKELTALGIDFLKPIVGIHIGATWPAKVWPADHFARLANMVVGKLGGQILVTYGPKDLTYLDKFSSGLCSRFTATEPKELRHLAAMISQCNVYVSNDAAPMHISAAVGTPTVGIFGPGEPDIWFPYEKNFGHIALHKDVPCCHRDFCEKKGDEYLQCMKAVAPEEVLEAVRNVLQTDNRKLITEN